MSRLYTEHGLRACDVRHVTRKDLEQIGTSAQECDTILELLANAPSVAKPDAASPDAASPVSEDSDEDDDTNGGTLGRTKSKQAADEFDRWLAAIHLEAYAPLLHQMGMDDVDDVGEVLEDASALEKIQLKIFEQARFLRAASTVEAAGAKGANHLDLAAEVGTFTRTPSGGVGLDRSASVGGDIIGWLGRHSLQHLIDPLVTDAGLHTCDLAHVTDEELTRAGVAEAADRKAFLLAVQQPDDVHAATIHSETTTPSKQGERMQSKPETDYKMDPGDDEIDVLTVESMMRTKTQQQDSLASDTNEQRLEAQPLYNNSPAPAEATPPPRTHDTPVLNWRTPDAGVHRTPATKPTAPQSAYGTVPSEPEPEESAEAVRIDAEKPEAQAQVQAGAEAEPEQESHRAGSQMQDAAQWLASVGLHQYVGVFAAQEMTVDSLRGLARAASGPHEHWREMKAELQHPPFSMTLGAVLALRERLLGSEYCDNRS